VATSPENGESLVYPHPAYHFHDQDRAADTRGAIADAAAVLRQDPALVALQAANVLLLPHPGFSCRECGKCCTMFRDAWQGHVSVEEVEAWQRLGLTRILRFVARVERPDYTLYKAWVHPVTGKWLTRCPWLGRYREGRALCRIHAVRPFKCRSFPLSHEQTERIGCQGFAPLPANPAVSHPAPDRTDSAPEPSL
jgi:Fe-S-cluster containining protein